MPFILGTERNGNVVRTSYRQFSALSVGIGLQGFSSAQVLVVRTE